MRHLIYYDPALLEGEEATSSMADFRAAVQKAGEYGPKFQLRDANQWRGEVEISENQYPGRVLLASSGANTALFDKIREAYTSVGSEVSDVGIDGPFEQGPPSSEVGEGDFDALKAEATALGVPFTESTEHGTLKNMVADVVRIKQAAQASLEVGRGDNLATNDTVNRENARVGAGDANARAGDLDPANMATEAEDGIKLTNADGEPAREVGNDDQAGVDDADADEADELTRLKAEADKLGVEYAPSIGVNTLRARVESARGE